ncbi:MAG: acyl-CoA dehydrogenase family protein [Pseudomonadota bacterium]
MDFTPSDDQRMVAESFGRVFTDEGDHWAALEEAGLARATWPEALDGAGMGLADMLPALVEAGRAATAAPVIGCGVMPGLALSRAGRAAPHVPDGRLCLAFQSARKDAGNAISGTLGPVPGGDLADQALVCMHGDRLAIVALRDRDAYELVDGSSAADLRLDAASPPAVGDTVPGLTDWLHDAAATAYCATALGAMLAARDMTLDYLGQRKQFGRPLSAFQVLQHRMVDLHHDTEHFLSLVHLAAHACDGSDPDLRARAVSALKIHLGGRIRDAAASAVQLHGGIGMTEDYALGRLVKRVLVADMLTGRTDMHRARLAGLIAQETRARSAKPEESAA